MYLSVLIVAVGWWHVLAIDGGRRWQIYLSKPLTLLLIISLAFEYRGLDQDGSHAWILLGLMLSLAGDILLMLPADRFLHGLLAFLVAHLCYLVGFSQGPLVLHLLDALLLLAPAAVLFGLLWRPMGVWRLPVLIYTLTLIGMTWFAAGAWRASLAVGSAAALVGSLLFLFTDAMIAIRRFHGAFRFANGLIMMSYFSAQFLVAASLAG